ncbi:hypothetical protein GGH94_003893 [Coemansia aciculifera]|uniref:3-hydroxyacyl-CoA dehydrogenase n=1 Tax=Coemansia aciculifera TaxID=417176 RepID=A0A9W8IJ76_9FUNG|nr:hypothetical protein GGH94_003893 [Coemansia aciculifera]KAJ2871578.1 hypothetical protein GGH93_004713 [Coemansia aciculifera]
MYSALSKSSQLLARGPAFSTSTMVQSPISRITVIGGGQMGSGIAQVAATHKHEVTLVDVNQEALDRGKSYMAKSLKRVAKKKFAEDEAAQSRFVDEIMGRVSLSTKPQEAVSRADLVIEAIVENIKVKQDLFAQLSKAAPQEAILASNTSSLPIGKIAELLDEQRKQRFIGLHFFNPVPQMKLVEVVRTKEVEQDVVDSAVAWVKAIGKAPAVCKDTPGFIVNRLLLPYMMESIRLLERDVASAQDIDTAMKLGAGYPMGPFELCDYVGLDTIKFIVDGWHKDGEGLKGNPLFTSSKKLDELVKQGRLGVKSGRGFYDY